MRVEPPPVEYLRTLFDYDPVTGIVVRKICTARRQKVGEIVGTFGARGYLQATIHRKKYMLHRLIWLWVHGENPEYDIDHKNRIRTDNRLTNLRLATRQENTHNAGISRRNWSGVTGVSWDANHCSWAANIKANGKQHFLGRYPSIQLAADAYSAAKRQFHPTALL
jgi:hypothetical protein